MFFESDFDSEAGKFFADIRIAAENIVGIMDHGTAFGTDRAGMAMVLAAVCAKGRSVIHNADNIFRGYANICEKLSGLGVEVTLEEQ